MKRTGKYAFFILYLSRRRARPIVHLDMMTCPNTGERSRVPSRTKNRLANSKAPVLEIRDFCREPKSSNIDAYSEASLLSAITISSPKTA